MVKLFHSPLFEQIRKYFVQYDSGDKTIFLFVPYIKTAVLEKLLDGIKNQTVIVTTWEPKDILSGSSEISLYQFCREHKIALYVSRNLHLKVYSVGLENAILATGNISHRGLLPGGNFEAGTIIEQMTSEDRIFFEKIRQDARLVDDIMYDELKRWYEENKTDLPEQMFLDDIISEPRKDNFLISALPMTRSIDELIKGYAKITLGMEPSDDYETSACIFHDLANYGIKIGLTEKEFLHELTTKFFTHPFIQRIDKFIAPEAYFGRIKEWVQDNCTDVPIPSRRELTGNVQALFEWFEVLGRGRYIVDVPGRHSQRIRNIEWKN